MWVGKGASRGELEPCKETPIHTSCPKPIVFIVPEIWSLSLLHQFLLARML